MFRWLIVLIVTWNTQSSCQEQKFSQIRSVKEREQQTTSQISKDISKAHLGHVAHVDFQDPKLVLSPWDTEASGSYFYLCISFFLNIFNRLISFLLCYLYSLKIWTYVWLWFTMDLPNYFISRAYQHLIDSILVAQFQIPEIYHLIRVEFSSSTISP